MQNAPRDEKNGLQDKWPSEEKINLCQGYCKHFKNQILINVNT